MELDRPQARADTLRVRAGVFQFEISPVPETSRCFSAPSWAERLPLEDHPRTDEAVRVLAMAFTELENRNAAGWTRANLVDRYLERIARLNIMDPLPVGVYRDNNGHARIRATRFLNNCAEQNGEPVDRCQICLGKCPGIDKAEPTL